MMAAQTQMSSFAKKLGGRVAQANAECAGKPIELDRKQLPAGIKNGVAKLSTMYTKEQDKDNGVCPKGEVFFRASAIVMVPEEYAGAITQIIIPLCDIPEKKGDGYVKQAVPFVTSWNKFRSLFEALGVAPFPEPPITPITMNGIMTNQAEVLAQSMRIEAYFMAAMKTLVDPMRIKTNPVYISYSTEGFTPKKTAAKPNPTEMVMEKWHGLAEFNGQHDPGSGCH